MRDVVWLAERQGDTRQTGGDLSSGDLKATAQVWVKIVPGAGGRRLAAGGIKTNYPYTLEMRKERTPKEGQSVLLRDGSILTVHAFYDKDYRNDRWVVLCSRTGATAADGKNFTNSWSAISAGTTITVNP